MTIVIFPITPHAVRLLTTYFGESARPLPARGASSTSSPITNNQSYPVLKTHISDIALCRHLTYDPACILLIPLLLLAPQRRDVVPYSRRFRRCGLPGPEKTGSSLGDHIAGSSHVNFLRCPRFPRRRISNLRFIHLHHCTHRHPPHRSRPDQPAGTAAGR